MKRSSNIHSSLCVENKKQRGISRLENLSNEVFYKIFDYLDGYDMIKAFNDLNYRLQTLINHPLISLKLKLETGISLPTEDFYQKIVQPNRNRLLSLHLMNSLVQNDFIHYFIFDASFIRLESLKLENLSKKNLLISCSFLTCLPRLTHLHLTVFETGYVSEIGQTLCLILSLPVLKRCIIMNGLDSNSRIPKIVFPTAINSKPSPIEHLAIDDVTPAGSIVSLLKYLPNIRRFDYGLSAQFTEISGKLETINLPHLKQLSLHGTSIGLNQCEALIKSIGHHVEILKVGRECYGDYLNAGRWERLIKKYLPRLKIFDMECVDIALERMRPIDHSIRPFFSSFWIERGWFASVIFSSYDVQFVIHPYKKQWFDRHREIEIHRMASQSSSHQNNCHELKKKPSRFNQIEVSDVFDPRNDSRWIDQIKDFLTKVPFTQLSVEGHQPLNSIFDIIGDSMMHFDSLILTWITNIDLQFLSEETTEIQLSFARKNRITKVKIESITKIEEIQYVMTFFPRMEYLELCITLDAIDVVTVLKFILTNRSMKVPNLRSICFEGVKIDRDVLDQLQQVIDGEPRIEKYHLTCVQNRIFIQLNQCDASNTDI